MVRIQAQSRAYGPDSSTEQRVWAGLKHSKQRPKLDFPSKSIVQSGLGDDGSDTNTQHKGKRGDDIDTNTVQSSRGDDGSVTNRWYNGKREGGLDTNTVQRCRVDDGSDTNTWHNGKRDDGLDTNTVQRCRVDDGPETNTGVERGQISDVEGTKTYQRMQPLR